MTKNSVAHRLVTDYSLIIGKNQWLINWLPIDYLLITHWFHWCYWCHWLVMSGLNKLEKAQNFFENQILAWKLLKTEKLWNIIMKTANPSSLIQQQKMSVLKILFWRVNTFLLKLILYRCGTVSTPGVLDFSNNCN